MTRPFKALGDGTVTTRGGQRRQNFTLEEESAVLKPFIERAREGGILVVGQIKHDFEAALRRAAHVFVVGLRCAVPPQLTKADSG
jgi:hypothetical protein